MTTDDLRTRAREAADKWQDDQGFSYDIPSRSRFIAGYLAHAAQQPTREQIARALAKAPDSTGTEAEDWLEEADAVLALLDGADR